MELKRNIYKDLMDWKNENSGKVLLLEGARQVGKTYILKKFGSENFKSHIYINMVDKSGEDFLACMEKAGEWTPGSGRKRPERPLHDALVQYTPDFTDDGETVVIIDEIQENAKVYSRIRQFAREFSCRFIVTGSYLGKTFSREYFHSAGDVDFLTMETLRFDEFLDALGKRDLYEGTDLYGGSDGEAYAELKRHYETYSQVGGYPSVVKTYVETGDLKQCEREIRKVVQIFTKESRAYFLDVVDHTVFEGVLIAIARLMVREKKGVSDLVTEVSKIVYRAESNKVTKKMVNNALGWLLSSHVVGYADKSIDCNYLDVVVNNRVYYSDVGLTHYFVRATGSPPETCNAIVAENFVYLAIRRRIGEDVAGSSPSFATYSATGGELDFYVRSLSDYKNYALEVKSTDDSAKTARALYKDKKVDYVYYLKGDTEGGITEDGRIRTVPIYFVDRITFDNG